ncbi:cell division protein FtsQ/DivIB [Plebeiibacterium marinum]|uniref:Cell division protein FtsQ n=1 Tax=Plebeiibacterium marinum TaxID=2992111 RepID=A0AAE3MAR1_9BACT|nr:cell division protein FtsQ [Plebeiobacterium marinum]MCW3804240.1 cell division protein FtsQ [Plebeiobacterium marinum]
MNFKKIRNISLWMLLIAFFPVVFAFVSKGKSEVVCSHVLVEVKDSVNAQFVTSTQIRSVLLNKYPRLLGGEVENINCEEIETFLKKHDAINECEAYCTVGGNLNVFIGQRKPLLRVFSGYDSYYIDEEGEKMPLSNQFAAHTLVLSGHVNTLDSLNEIIEFARFIEGDPFWNSQIEQIYVENNGEFSLAPRVGDQIVYLGSLENYAVKMRNLYAFYTHGLHPREWNNYREINLKYKDQIICTKK